MDLMPAKLRPVTKLTAEAQSTDNLRTFIMSGNLSPGARLKEVQLAQELGVARATLRTSLMRLRDEGMVVQIPYTGWQVVELTSTDVWELWTLRGSLESLAAKMVAERLDGSLERQIETAFANLQDACKRGEIGEVNEADFSLHRTIITLAGNKRLRDLYRHVEQQVRFFIATSNQMVSDDLNEITKQHEPLVDAILARNSRSAAEEAWNHNETEGGKLVVALRKQKRTNSADA